MTQLRLVAATDAAATAAGMIVDTLRDATAGRRRASFAVSGGATPWQALALLRPDDLDWSLVDVFQVDERIAPRGDPARNLVGLERSLLSRVPAVAHPMPVEAPDLAAAAAAYAASLPAEFDLIQLGLGTDGHTASLVPGDPVLDARTDVAITGPYAAPTVPASSRDPVAQRPGSVADGPRVERAVSEGGGHRRMTLAAPAINRARSVLWIVTGASKREALAALLAGDADIPANRISRDNAVVIADEAALGR